jgi:hypothetical protein
MAEENEFGVVPYSHQPCHRFGREAFLKYAYLAQIHPSGFTETHRQIRGGRW